MCEKNEMCRVAQSCQPALFNMEIHAMAQRRQELVVFILMHQLSKLSYVRMFVLGGLSYNCRSRPEAMGGGTCPQSYYII